MLESDWGKLESYFELDFKRGSFHSGEWRKLRLRI